MDALVGVYKEPLASHGDRLPTGTRVDASVVPVPRHRNPREEHTLRKGGTVPPEWEAESNKWCQKDTDVQWFRKEGVNHYDYKHPLRLTVRPNGLPLGKSPRPMSMTARSLRSFWGLPLLVIIGCGQTVHTGRRKGVNFYVRWDSNPGSMSRVSEEEP